MMLFPVETNADEYGGLSWDDPPAWDDAPINARFGTHWWRYRVGRGRMDARRWWQMIGSRALQITPFSWRCLGGFARRSERESDSRIYIEQRDDLPARSDLDARGVCRCGCGYGEDPEF